MYAKSRLVHGTPNAVQPRVRYPSGDGAFKKTPIACLLHVTSRNFMSRGYSNMFDESLMASAASG